MGTVLLGCGHLFCNECWVHHVTNRVLMSDTKMHCPAYKCESIVDKTTLLSLLPDTLTHIHLNRLHSNRINADPQWRWCPNPKCGRLVRIQEGKDMTGPKSSELKVSQKALGVPVPCECGALWCSECNEEAHWPASCKQAALHLKNMKEIVLDSVKSSERITSVEVKRCPSCKNPMEKNGGCTHMTCNCGYDFCWKCLVEWKNHDWNMWPLRCPKPLENLETVMLSESRRRQSVSFTEIAIENRKMRSHHIITNHHEAALKLARRMFFVPETPATDDDMFPACIRMPGGPMAWSYSSDHADQSRLMALVARASKMAAFIAEVRTLLEYVCIMMALVPSRIRRRRSGWKTIIFRLSFIACQMEELLGSHRSRPAEDVWRRLQALQHQGQLCLKDVTRTAPLLHQGPEDIKGQGSKVTAGNV